MSIRERARAIVIQNRNMEKLSHDYVLGRAASKVGLDVGRAIKLAKS